MAVTSTAATDAGQDSTDPANGSDGRRASPAGRSNTIRDHAPDLVICLIFLVVAGWVTHGLWPDPGSRVLALNPEDQTLYEWFLANDARLLFGDVGLRTDRLNAPDGVNLMANTTVILLGVVFAPVTLLFGVPVTFAVLAGLCLAATAIAWYLLFTRTARLHRFAAALGAGLCGFAPAMISQTNSHLHMTAQFMVPVIVWLVVRLVRAADPAGGAGPASTARPASTADPASPADPTGVSGPDRRRIVTSGLGLGAAVTAQVFIGEEVVFLTALTLVVITLAYAAVNWPHVRRILPGAAAGMALAVGSASLVLAYPLWFQFAGPGSVPNGMFSPHYFSADLASWSAFSPLSVTGSDDSARLTTGPAEYNTFLGWPLIVVAVGCTAWLIRRPLVSACTIATVVMAALSLGPELVIDGVRTTISGPYALLLGVPVIDGALPMRFAVAAVPLIATVLAFAVDRALRAPGRPVRLLVPGAVAVALATVFPAPLPTAERPPLPQFITGGHWRDCVEPGGVLVPVPLPTPQEPWPQRWAAAANAEFALPEGFFIGPYAADGRASMGTYKQATSALLAEVARTGAVPAIDDEDRQRAGADIDFWGASCVALADGTANGDSLRNALEQLLGPPTRSADAWTWKVR
ncbi:hypothetical protein [Polymorphospora rubra]|uniref:hypothetical protein n=1 Tax=Polymorphospora rubra TaxID=338584 RepID=UPI003F4CBC66